MDDAVKQKAELRLQDEEAQQRMDDVDYRDEFADKILSHIAKTGHSIGITTISKGTPQQQTFMICASCPDFGLNEVDLQHCTYTRELRKELKL